MKLIRRLDGSRGLESFVGCVAGSKNSRTSSQGRGGEEENDFGGRFRWSILGRQCALASSHHHQPGRASFCHETASVNGRVQSALPVRRPRTAIASRSSPRTTTHSWLGAHGSQSVSLAIHPSFDLEVVVCKHQLAIHTREASRVEFLFDRRASSAFRCAGGLEVLALNSAVAART